MTHNCPICQILTTYKWKELSSNFSFFACSRLHAIKTFLSLQSLSSNLNIIKIEMIGYNECNHRVEWEPAEIQQIQQKQIQDQSQQEQIAA